MPAFQFAPPRRRCRIVYEMFPLLLLLSPSVRPRRYVMWFWRQPGRGRSVARRWAGEEEEEEEEAANGKQDRFSVPSVMSGTDGMG